MLIQCGGGETMLDDSVELAAKAARESCCCVLFQLGIKLVYHQTLFADCNCVVAWLA